MSEPKRASGEVQAPAAFLASRVAPRHAAAVRELAQRIEELQRRLRELREAEGTLCWLVEGFPAAYLNLSGGSMEVAAQPAHEPFLTVRMGRESWELFSSGKVPLRFFEGSSERGGLTRSRIERLQGIRGMVRFALSGLPEGGRWIFDVALGGPPHDPPEASVSLSVETAAKMQSGELLPQAAFLQGLVQVTGDVALLTRLAGALFG